MQSQFKGGAPWRYCRAAELCVPVISSPMASYCIIKSSWSLQKRKLKNKSSFIIDAGTLTWTWFQWWKVVITVTLGWHERGIRLDVWFLFNRCCLTSADFLIPSKRNILNRSRKTAGVFCEIWRLQVISDSVRQRHENAAVAAGVPARHHHSSKLHVELTSRPMMGGWLQLQSHFDSVNQESGNGIRLH